MTSKNIVFPSAMRVELLDEPLPELGAHDVLLRTRLSMVSAGTECICLKGEFDPGTNWGEYYKFPCHPGSSAVFTVERVGAEVTKVKPGDRVMRESSHRQFLVAQEDSLLVLPADVSDESALWLVLSLVAQNGIRRAQVQMGDTVAVIGTGQVGQLLIQFSRICGATRIIAIGSGKNRAELSRKSGATDVILKRASDAMDDLKAMLNSELPDIVIDATGNPYVLQYACQMVRPYGKLLLVGDTSTPSKQVLGPGVVSNYISILGSHSTMVAKQDNPFYPYTRERIYQTSLRYIQQGSLRLDHMMSVRYSPEEMPDVYMELIKGGRDLMGIVIDWTKYKI